MAKSKKDSRVVVSLQSTVSNDMHTTEKNRRNDPQRLEIRKYDPVARQHALYRETK